MTNKLILRIILSPLVFIWGLLLLAAGTLFPVTFIVFISMVGLFVEPFVWLFKKAGVEIESMDPFIHETGNTALGHFLGLTIHIWGAFFVVYLFVKEGHLFTGDELN